LRLEVAGDLYGQKPGRQGSFGEDSAPSRDRTADSLADILP